MPMKMRIRMTIWIGILSFLVWVSPAHAVAYKYTIIDYPGEPSTFIYAINSSGTEMAGWLPSGHGFKTDGKVFTPVDVPGYPPTYALGINAAGKIVGQCFSGSTSRGFVNTGDDYTVFDVPVPGTTNTSPFKINNSDQIVGTYYTPSYHGFVKTGESFYYFDYPGSTDTEARGINNKGQVVGRYWDADQKIHGYVHDIIKNTYTTIDYPGAVATGIFGINDLGQMVGYYQDGQGSWHALVYYNAAFTILHIPGEGVYSIANDIDKHGNVVGAYRYDSSNFHGFLAQPEEPTFQNIRVYLSPSTRGFWETFRSGIAFVLGLSQDRGKNLLNNPDPYTGGLQPPIPKGIYYLYLANINDPVWDQTDPYIRIFTADESSPYIEAHFDKGTSQPGTFNLWSRTSQSSGNDPSQILPDPLPEIYLGWAKGSADLVRRDAYNTGADGVNDYYLVLGIGVKPVKPYMPTGALSILLVD